MVPLHSPKIQLIIDEAESLTAALRCVRGDGNRVDALRRIQEVYDSHDVDDDISRLIHICMARVIGEPSGGDIDLVDPSDIEGHIFSVIAGAWLSWLRDVDREQAHEQLRKIPVPAGASREGSAIHLLAMQPWAKAVDALLRDDPEEAKRQFHRAAELGSQNGTASSQAVQWTFAASFLYFGK